MGNGTTEPIQDVQVGQRVATDGGLSNNGSAAADPNATQVNPKTWRLVSLELDATTSNGAEDRMFVRELMPLSELRQEHAKTGAQIAVPVDLGEIGELGYSAIVESISACPAIQGGPGRVVLTTFTHLNNFVFDLTVSNATGQVETLGVTGFHKLYAEDRGWTSVADLRPGEKIRGEHGDLTVAGMSSDAGVHWVYNLTVETDHVYYVGNLDALSHNINDCSTVDAQGHHSDPEFMGGDPDQPLTNMSPEDHADLHSDLNEHLSNYYDENGNTMAPSSTNSGPNIQENFTREERLSALADFYGDPEIAASYPDAAADFFAQHPDLIGG